VARGVGAGLGVGVVVTEVVNEPGDFKSWI